MALYDRYQPKCFADLVFENADVASTIHRYTTGQKTKHLLLYGPPGSGKSAAARVIVDTCAPCTANTGINDPIDPQKLDDPKFEIAFTVWNWQYLRGAKRGYAIIDEVDTLKPAVRQGLRSVIDSTNIGTFICTTNNPHLLENPLLNRFTKLELKLPTAQHWLPRAKAIMSSERFNLTEDHLKDLLGNNASSARDMLEALEDALAFLKDQETQQMSASLPPSNLIRFDKSAKQK